MRLKESNQLELLAGIAGKSFEDLSNDITNCIQDKNLIDEDSEYWGYALFECLKGETPIASIAEVMEICGIPATSKNYETFLDLVLILDGDCPNCGYDMVMTKGKRIHIAGDGYLSEMEFREVWEEKSCHNCNSVVSRDEY